jgi:hypothetical protein
MFELTSPDLDGLVALMRALRSFEDAKELYDLETEVHPSPTFTPRLSRPGPCAAHCAGPVRYLYPPLVSGFCVGPVLRLCPSALCPRRVGCRLPGSIY